MEEAVANPLPTLTDDSQAELRRLFRKAAAQAHPDRFINDPTRCKQATEFVARLNAAHAQKDLDTLRRLVDELTDGRVFSTAIETGSDGAVLEKRLSRLMALKAKLLTQIETIEQDEAYLWMTAEGDVQERLMVLQEELSKQNEALICAL